MGPQIISFRCSILNSLGKVLSVSYNEEVINQVGEDGDSRLAAFIRGLQSVKVGEKRKIFVPAEEAYGPYDPHLLLTLELKNFPSGKQVSLGNQIVYPHSRSPEAKIYRVVEKTATTMTLEGNHIFAGMDLIFEVEIFSARDADPEDLLQQSPTWLSQNIH